MSNPSFKEKEKKFLRKKPKRETSYHDYRAIRARLTYLHKTSLKKGQYFNKVKYLKSIPDQYKKIKNDTLLQSFGFLLMDKSKSVQPPRKKSIQISNASHSVSKIMETSSSFGTDEGSDSSNMGGKNTKILKVKQMRQAFSVEVGDLTPKRFKVNNEDRRQSMMQQPLANQLAYKQAKKSPTKKVHSSDRIMKQQTLNVIQEESNMKITPIQR